MKEKYELFDKCKVIKKLNNKSPGKSARTILKIIGDMTMVFSSFNLIATVDGFESKLSALKIAKKKRSK